MGFPRLIADKSASAPVGDKQSRGWKKAFYDFPSDLAQGLYQFSRANDFTLPSAFLSKIRQIAFVPGNMGGIFD